MKILFVIDSLGGGGAERQLAMLAKGLASRGHSVAVAVRQVGGNHHDDIRAAGIEVRHLTSKRDFGLRALVGLLRGEEWDVAYSFLPDSNWRLAVASIAARGPRIVWGLRASEVDLSRYGRRARVAWLLARWLSRKPHLIIANSHVGAQYHASNGYPKRSMTVISNGIDTDIFRPSEELRQAHRTLLGFEVNTPVVGVLGRFDVAKGQLDFLGVFASVVAKLPSARAVLVGSCTDADRTELLRRAHSLGISASVDTFGESRHPEAVLNAIDVLALPSRTEGFPNVLAEAAACGTPAVAYDVGDVSSIAVAPCCVVPPGDERAFAEGLVRLLAEPPGLHERQALRRHIAARFSVARLLDMTEAALAACLVARERPGKGLTRESR